MESRAILRMDMELYIGIVVRPLFTLLATSDTDRSSYGP